MSDRAEMGKLDNPTLSERVVSKFKEGRSMAEIATTLRIPLAEVESMLRSELKPGG